VAIPRARDGCFFSGDDAAAKAQVAALIGRPRILWHRPWAVSGRAGGWCNFRAARFPALNLVKFD
jgi:hypothetical protein